MSELASELRAIFEKLQSAVRRLEDSTLLESADALEKSAKEVGKAWGHSWLGYQSRVYYEGLQSPPPGAHFSSEWGFEELYTMGTCGDWQEFPEGAVEAEIRRRAGDPDTSSVQTESDCVRKVFQQSRDDVISVLRIAKSKQDDSFLDKLREEAEQVRALTAGEIIHHMCPSGKMMSRDMIALSQGLWTPPHVSILAEALAIRSPKAACESLANIARRAFSHLERAEKKQADVHRIGTNVFIGHGRSKEWMGLRDFIKDRMRLPWDEFNRVAVAGIPNTVRLSTMLDAAAIGFLVLTADDERADGKPQARMNVVHGTCFKCSNCGGTSGCS